jgi:hypothetical protein
MNKTSLLSTVTALFLFSIMFSAPSVASVALSIDDPIPSRHTIALDPVTFTVTNNGTVGGIIFEDFFLTPNTSSGTHVTTVMTAQIDGGSPFSIAGTSANGTYSGTVSLLDPDDLWFNILTSDEFAVTVGQTVTIGGTSIFTNPELAPINTSFDQTAILWEENSIALSDPTSLAPIPVPAAVWLFGSGLIGLTGVARRKKS